MNTHDSAAPDDPQIDRHLGMDRQITRRDFLNGVAVGVGGTLTGALAPAGVLHAAGGAQDQPGYYPPALTGMRGSHDGSFDAAHGLRDGSFWRDAGRPTDTRETYDVVIAGGGISGLAAAFFYRERTNSSARILILDNHDDFGGHAKRNEFDPGGRLLLANGGTLSIESPFPFSQEARGLFDRLGVDPPALEAKCANREVYKGLKTAYFFDKETFGVDQLVVGAPGFQATLSAWAEYLARTPLSAQVQKDIARIQEGSVDYLPGLSSAEKKDRISRVSYKTFLLDMAKVHPDVIPFYQSRTHGLYGIGIDAVPALDCWGIGFPGFQGMQLDPGPAPRMSFTALGEAKEKEPYHFHFPDGNASIARLLVRALVPGAVPGSTAEDVVTARVDYTRLDRSDAPVRVRLSSTCVRAVHNGDAAAPTGVEVTYARGRDLFSVRARHVVLACWNMMIPYICPELPEAQKQALHYGVKVPLVYTVVAVRNWHAFHSLGIQRVSSPGMYHTGVSLDQPIDIGDYKCPKSPDEPILLRMTRTPCQPGLPARDQHRMGHLELFTTPFSVFERNIRDQLARILGSAGFDPARDIDAITVNRWPHGYAYEYNPLWDPEWPDGQQPCQIARQRFGRIAIANSDAAAAAYTDQAIDQAHRAVHELLTVS